MRDWDGGGKVRGRRVVRLVQTNSTQARGWGKRTSVRDKGMFVVFGNWGGLDSPPDPLRLVTLKTFLNCLRGISLSRVLA